MQLFAFMLGGIVVSYIINKLLLSFSQSLGIRNRNDVVIRWSNQSKPSLGGISFFAVFLFSAMAFSVVFSDEYIFRNPQFIGLLAAGSLAFLMGLADDAYNTKPLIKLAVQIACGVIFVLTHSYIEFTHNYWIDAVITVIWVVFVMNSLNMLDNMDGITGTTVVFILLACLFSSFLVLDLNRNIWSILIITQIGALIGFLRFNVHPSKLFMGDAGSQFIGLFVAFIAIKNLCNAGATTANPSWIGFFICLVAFTPTAVDTLTVVINRLKKGQSPMVGGKDHTTHHLVYSGLNDRQVWYVFIVISALAMMLSVTMVYLSTMHILLPLIIISTYFVIVFAILFNLTRKKNGPPTRK